MLKSVFLICLTSLQVFSQSPASNQSKYWFYRYRLTSEFLKKGVIEECPNDIVAHGGFSIPAGGAYSQEEDLHFGDGTSHLGYYIGVLATEFKLLKSNGASLTQMNRIREELFFALKAYERVDIMMEKLRGSGVGGIDFGNVCTDLNGFFLRDDVPYNSRSGFYGTYKTSYHEGFKTPYRPFVPEAGKIYTDLPFKSISSDFGEAFGHFPCDGDPLRFPSQDQISDLYVGLALTISCVDPYENYKGYYFRAKAHDYAKLIADRMLKYNYKIVIPNSDNCVAKYGGTEVQLNSYGLAKAFEALANYNLGQDKAVQVGFNETGDYQNGMTSISRNVWQNFLGYPTGGKIYSYNYLNAPYTIGWGLPAPWDESHFGTGNDYNNALIAQFGAVGNSWKVGLIPFKALDLNIKLPWRCPRVNYTCQDGVCLCCRSWCNIKGRVCYPDGLTWWDCGPDIHFRVWCYNNPSKILEVFTNQVIGKIAFETNLPLGHVASEVVGALQAIVPDISLCAPVQLPELTYNTTALTLSEYGKQFKFDPMALLHRQLHNNGIYSYNKDQFYYYMNTAPCTGPHKKPYRDRHNPPTNLNTPNNPYNGPNWDEPSPDPGVKGWQVDNRWQKANADYYADGGSGAWPGLDYMFLYNLYHLIHGREDGWQVYTDKLNVEINGQSYNTFKKVTAYETITASNTTVASNGNVEFRAGENIKLSNFSVKTGSSFNAKVNPVFACNEITDGTSNLRVESGTYPNINATTEPQLDTLKSADVHRMVQNELNNSVPAFMENVRQAEKAYKQYEPINDYVTRQTASYNASQYISVTLSPNPAITALIAQITGNLGTQIAWTITDSYGQVRLQGTKGVTITNSETVNVSIGALAPGVYSFRAESGSMSKSSQFIKN